MPKYFLRLLHSLLDISDSSFLFEFERKHMIFIDYLLDLKWHSHMCLYPYLYHGIYTVKWQYWRKLSFEHLFESRRYIPGRLN